MLCSQPYMQSTVPEPPKSADVALRANSIKYLLQDFSYAAFGGFRLLSLITYVDNFQYSPQLAAKSSRLCFGQGGRPKAALGDGRPIVTLIP